MLPVLPAPELAPMLEPDLGLGLCLDLGRLERDLAPLMALDLDPGYFG